MVEYHHPVTIPAILDGTNFVLKIYGDLRQRTGAGVARAWRGRGAGYRQFLLGLGGAGVARAWRGHGAGMSCDPCTSMTPP
eukprot:gene18962-biopygen14524